MTAASDLQTAETPVSSGIPAVTPDDRPDEYVIEPLPDAEHEGWFPLGEVSLIAGSSGTGKTTWLLQVLEQVRQGQNVFGHRTSARAYCVLLHDRSKRSFRRTLRRMKLAKEVERSVHRLTSEQQKNQTPQGVVEAILKDNSGAYSIIVIEGLDMWAPSGKAAGDLVSAAAFVDDLQRIAERYNVAIIGTVGSPKQKPKDRYEMQRDSVFGSSAIGRKVETIVFLQLSDLREPNSLRECHVLTRQGKAEKFKFRFQVGRLVEESELPPFPPLIPPKTKLELYLDRLKTGEAVKWSPETGMSEATFYRALSKAHKDGLVFKDRGATYKA